MPMDSGKYLKCIFLCVGSGELPSYSRVSTEADKGEKKKIWDVRLLIIWILNVPKGPCIEDLVPTPYQYGEKVESLGGGA
jgi:hypothetical protein